MLVTNYENWYRENLRLDRENTGNLKVQFVWVTWLKSSFLFSLNLFSLKSNFTASHAILGVFSIDIHDLFCREKNYGKLPGFI